MFSSTSKKLTVLLLAVIFVCSVVGVQATWSYATGDATHVLGEGVKIESFPWEGSEILPDDENGNNHRLLIDNILNGTMEESGQTVGIGLNTPTSEINQQIENRTDRGYYVFGSMDFWTSNQMKALFGTEAIGLEFLIYSPHDTPNVKYLFTTGVEFGTTGGLWDTSGFNYPTGTRIYPIYRTRLEYLPQVDGETGKTEYRWIAMKTVLGSAESAVYPNSMAGTLLTKTPGLDPETFAPISAADCETGESAVVLGTNVNNAIHTYVGQVLEGKVDTANTTVYFKIAPKSNGTVVFTPTARAEGLVVNVYSDRAMTNLVSTMQANGTITFTATASTTYYFTVSGSTYMEFAIAYSN